METTATQGTSIAVLAPYLPYGIEVQLTHEDDLPERGLLTGFVHRNTCVRLEYKEEGEMMQPFGPMSRCLPVLRSLADLSTPLADGTVPLCRIAEMTFWTKGFTVEGDGLTCSMMSRGYRLRLSVAAGSWDITVREGQGRMQDAPLRGQAAIFDYLRSLHFALPINGRPLVEGVDYIRAALPAAPATPATREEVGA